MVRVGIVGAGAAAAAATAALDDAATETEITVLEKSRGLCGRAATRRRNGIVYDYGANYVKNDDERVVDLLTETLDTEGWSTSRHRSGPSIATGPSPKGTTAADGSGPTGGG